MTHNMTITIEDLQSIPIGQIEGALASASKKALKEVTLYDFLLSGDFPLRYVHGVYVFYAEDGQKSLYVGKVEKPQFIERVPAHLAPGRGSWFNGFLRHHSNATSEGDLDKALLTTRDCLLLLVLAPYDIASKLETVLIRELKPSYNSKRPKVNASESPDGENEHLSSLLNRM